VILGVSQNRSDISFYLFRWMYHYNIIGTKLELAIERMVELYVISWNAMILDKHKEVHEDIIRKGIHLYVFVKSALLHMYIKCEKIEDVRMHKEFFLSCLHFQQNLYI